MSSPGEQQEEGPTTWCGWATEPLGADFRPAFDTFVPRQNLAGGTLWAPLPSEKKSNALSTTLKSCCHLAPCYPIQPHLLVVLHTGTSLSRFCILLGCSSAGRPLPSCSLTAVVLGLQGPDQHRCLCLSRHFLQPCFSVWLVTHFSPMNCHLLERGDGLTPSILMVPHPSVRPSFPDYLTGNHIPIALPMLHPGLFSL